MIFLQRLGGDLKRVQSLQVYGKVTTTVEHTRRIAFMQQEGQNKFRNLATSHKSKLLSVPLKIPTKT